MSLHIGRLSPQVRQEELEHVFRRFGRCIVRLKDGYGFAVYDVTADAVRAMQALRGKIVCGERITLNWSNRQPRTSQDFKRSSRFYEPYRGRNFREGEISFRFRGSYTQKDHPANHNQRHTPDDAPEKQADEIDENMKDAGENIGEVPKEMKRDEGGISDANAIEIDRWGETGNGTLAPSGGDGDDFDRYEPYHGYDKREKTENFNKASSYDSPDHRYSSEKKWREHSFQHVDRNLDKSKAPPTCYNCGIVGHIMRNCPQGEVRGGKFKQWRDGLSFREKRELRLKRFGSASFRRSDYDIDPVIQAQHRVRGGRVAFSERTRRAPRLSKMSPDSRRKRRVYDREDSQQASKKACKRSRSGRSRGSSLSSDSYSMSSHSDSRPKRSHSSGTSSDSISASSRSRSRFRSHSRSAYSSSKSASPSTQSEGSRSKSRSNISFPVSLSVSVSPQHRSTPSPENKQLDAYMNSSLEANVENRTVTGSKHLPDIKQEVNYSTLDSEVAVTSFKADTRSNGEPHIPGQNVQYSARMAGYTETNLGENLLDDDDDVTHDIQGQSTNLEDTSSVKSNQEILTKNERSNSLKLTSNEVVSALKHYGMEAPDVGSLDLPVEEYLGAARLWPWELIYYRRLKKGPISTENYARRLEQNKECGIVDQYVRSSSGWWESN